MTESLVDLHVHTVKLSLDSGLAPAVAVSRAKAQGLSAICFTEHNAAWTPADLKAVSEESEFPVFGGMEVSTNVGHVLVFGIDRYGYEMSDVRVLRRIVRSEGGAMVLAHPNRSPAYSGPWSEAAELFDAVEAANGDESAASFRLVEEIASSLGLPVVGGSDAHTGAGVGRTHTVFASLVCDDRALIDFLHAGRVTPGVRHLGG